MNFKWKDIREAFSLPHISIDLMFEKTIGNDPFFADVVEYFYTLATSAHSKLVFIKKYEYGFALCRLPPTFDEYFKSLEFTARQNYRKALRSGFSVRRFHFNDYLDDVRAIWMSTPVRQGEMPEE